MIIGSIAKDGVRFFSFDEIKSFFQDPESGTLSPLRSLLAGMASGVVASVFAVTPTERIKTAMLTMPGTFRGSVSLRLPTQCD